MSSNCNNYREQILRLVVNQFRESEHFLRLLNEQALSYDNIDCIMQYLYDNLNVDAAEGVWLDLIGVIVGQPREISNAVPIFFFAFDEYPAAGRFDEERFWDGSEPLGASSVLSDPEYRWAIKARINSNYANVSKVGLTESMAILVNTPDILVGNQGDAKVNIFWGVDIPVSLQFLMDAIDLLPIAGGVGVAHRMFGVPAVTFSFLETPLGFAGFDQGNFVGEF
jgi:hypothetical protein